MDENEISYYNMLLNVLNFSEEKDHLDEILSILKKCDFDIVKKSQMDLNIKRENQSTYMTNVYRKLLGVVFRNNEQKVKHDIYKILIKYVIIFYLYNMNQMSKIYREDKYLSLNVYNIDNNYKAASRGLKNKFKKNGFKFILKDGCLFDGDDNEEYIEWKFDLFNILGIKFESEYLKSDSGKRKFYKYFDISSLFNPMEENDVKFPKIDINYSTATDLKEIEELYEAICENRKLPSEFYIAECYLKRKKGSDDEKQAYKEAVIEVEDEEDEEIWWISKPIFISSKYYQKNIADLIDKFANIVGIDIQVDEEIYQKLIGTTQNEKKYCIEIKINSIERVPLIYKFKYSFFSFMKYRLSTNFPNTIFEPVYDATFSSITYNPYFNSPMKIKTLTQNKVSLFYTEYYFKLNRKLENERCLSGECYWLSEKLYGVNFLKKMLEDIVGERVVNVTNGEKTSTKFHFTKDFVEFVNRLSEIDIPELQFFYWELFVISKTDIKSILDCIELLDMVEVTNVCEEYFLKHFVRSTTFSDDAQKQFFDKYTKKYVNKHLEEYGEENFIQKVKRDIRMIYNKPDVEFLKSKGMQKYIKCICLETKWFSKYISVLRPSDNRKGMWEA